MKKFLSIILALVTMFCIGTTAFAYENVDNTFDNFTPGPGVQAPDNWYDPYCYDADGTIRMDCFSAEDCTYYCHKYKKIYTNYSQIIPGVSSFFNPYCFTLSSAKYGTAEYCPYCGETNDLYFGLENLPKSDFQTKHTVINDVYFAAVCDSCGNCIIKRYDKHMTSFGCTNCYYGNNPTTFYRFIPDSYKNAEFTFIFSESAHKYGDGIDRSLNELKLNKDGYYEGWHPNNNSSDSNLNPDSPEIPDEEPTELTFWQQIVQFFQNIANFFVKFFTWSW